MGLLADVSVWSADLANLEASLGAVDRETDWFHFDVADGHFSPSLLFFPDLVAAARRLTARPFHVHLMVERPACLVNVFAEAGADVITVHVETGDAEVRRALEAIRARSLTPGLAARLETPLSEIEPYLGDCEVVLLLGTPAGSKGHDLATGACPRMRELCAALCRRGIRERVLTVADGGIRRHTVPLLRAAGADAVVPGSLVFGSESPLETLQWIRSL